MFSLKNLKKVKINLIQNNPSQKLFSDKISKNLQIKFNRKNDNRKNDNFNNININHFNKFNFSNKFNEKADIFPDHLFYEIPKYQKNPDNIDLPWLIGGAPFLELKVNSNKNY